MSTQVLETKQKIYTIALAGQPNTGKSTIFNRLTGANQHVGNWPGKTVEKKEGAYKYDGGSYKIVDLPGTYSLTANSLEEIITRDFIIKEEPDVVVVVVDASQLEGDKEIIEVMKDSLGQVKWNTVERITGENGSGALIVADSRYKWIQKILTSAVKRPDREKTLAMRSKFDRVATHPIWGKFIALGVIIIALMGAMIIGFPLSMGVMSGLMPMAIGGANTLLASAPAWLNSMFTDGIIVGVGVATAMFVFLMAVFIVIGFLEDVGYMPRLAYVFDRSMHRMGLHGKSFMPFMMSLTCNIAGVLGARVIDSWRQRLITMIMGPIIPCMAMWGVVSFIGILFFGVNAPLIVVALLIVMVFHLFLTSFLLRRFVVKGEQTGLIMDLPPYHKPNFKTIWEYTWTHGKAFLKRGFTLIAVVSFFVWLLSYLPNGNIETSFLASTGKFLNPIGKLMGFDWRLMVALVAAVASKEAALASLAIIYGIGQGASSITGAIFASGIYEHAALGSILTQAITPAAALAFIFAFFFSIPCLGTVGVIYSETKSLKWTVGASAYYTVSSLIAGILAYNVGLLIF